MLVRLTYLAALLMCFSRPFAKIGFGGVYITEVTVLLLIPSILFNKEGRRHILEFVLSGMVLYHVAFILFVDVSRYSIGEVIRDAIIWLYPVVTFYVAKQRDVDIDQLMRVFQKVINVFLFVYPVIFYFSYLGGPDTVGNIHVKKTDTTIALAVYVWVSFYFKKIKPIHLFLLVVDSFLVSTQGRSSLMILFLNLSCAAYFNRNVLRLSYIPRKYVILGVVAILVVGLVSLPSARQRGRDINFTQVLENAASIFGDSGSQSNLEDTEAFRIFWWIKIIDESIEKNFLLYGNGYGLNLADFHGFQVLKDGSLRSPHNFVMTLLSRSGWLITILMVMFVGIISLIGLRLGGVYIGFSVLLAMMFLNAFFDVYLEGPMGAFPFWLFVGLIISKLNDHRRDRRTQSGLIDGSNESMDG